MHTPKQRSTAQLAQALTAKLQQASQQPKPTVKQKAAGKLFNLFIQCVKPKQT